MIIDFVRLLDGQDVPLPPFHTGPLGLFPGTEISVSLMHERRFYDAPCELAVTPFSEDLDNLFRLECSLREKKGVVKLLLDAVALLQLNIVTLECGVRNHMTEHHIEMVLDWQHSQYRASHETPRRVHDTYEYLAHRIPVHDWRYVLLYELIMCLCGSDVLVDKALGRPLPSISVIPFKPTPRFGHTRVEVQSMQNLARKVQPKVKRLLPRTQFCTGTISLKSPKPKRMRSGTRPVMAKRKSCLVS